MEQNWESRNEPKQIYSTEFCQTSKGNLMKDSKERIVTSTNGVGTLRHHFVKQNKESMSISQNTTEVQI